MKGYMKKIVWILCVIAMVVGMSFVYKYTKENKANTNQEASIVTIEKKGQVEQTEYGTGEDIKLYNIYLLINELEVESQTSMAGSKVKISSESDLSFSYYDGKTDAIIEEVSGKVAVPEDGIKLKVDGIVVGNIYEVKIEVKEAVEGYASQINEATIEIDASTEEISCRIKEIKKTESGEEVTLNNSEENTAIMLYEETDGTVKLYGNEDLKIYYYVADKNGKTDEELREVEWSLYNSESGIEIEKNGIIYAKSQYKEGAASKITNLRINNIDKLAPTIEVESIEENATRDEASIKIKMEDQEGTEEYGKSGIYGYAITKQEEEPAEFVATDEEVTIEGITDNGTYYVWVKDKAGNVTHEEVEVTVITYTTDDIVAIILAVPGEGGRGVTESGLVGTEYTSLSSLINKLDEKGITEARGKVVVQIVNNIKNEAIKINDKNIEIDLNGYTVTSRLQESTFNVEKGNLKIVDEKYDIADYIENEELASTLKTKYQASDEYGKVYNPNYIGIEIQAEGTLTLGEDNSTGYNDIEYPDHNSPIIEGEIKGIVNYGGIFNYYDGIIYGRTTIDGAVTNTPLLYDPTVIETEDGELRATLEIVSNVEAMIGKTRYTKLESAIEAANNIKGTPEDQIEIDIVRDITKDQTIEIDETKNIKLDLNGFIVTNLINDYVIKNNGKLEIIDSAVEEAKENFGKTKLLGELTNNGDYYFVENEEGQLIPTNGKTYQVAHGGTGGIQKSTANSCVEIDLTEQAGEFYVVVNASVSSQSSYAYGYATITESMAAPAYSSSTGRFMCISGTKGVTDYQSSKLEGGKIYYLHIGYYKDNSTGDRRRSSKSK